MLRPCGTVAAYQRHRDNNEDTCRPCKDAKNVYTRYSRTDEFRRQLNTAPMIVLDYVETFQPVTLVELVVLIRLRHGRAEGTIRRAVSRMLNDQRLVRDGDWLEVGDG